jgi:hypothetical protein
LNKYWANSPAQCIKSFRIKQLSLSTFPACASWASGYLVCLDMLVPPLKSHQRKQIILELSKIKANF